MIGGGRKIAHEYYPVQDDAADRLARDTLIRAAAFFAALPDRNGARYPAKVAGNSLRELDRFLNLLLDAIALRLSPVAFDRLACARQRNAANKLRSVLAVAAMPSPDHERLRAIGRTRDWLFHRGGIAAEPCHHADLATSIGHHSRIAGSPTETDCITLNAADRAAIGAFYHRLASDVFDRAAEPATHSRVATRP